MLYHLANAIDICSCLPQPLGTRNTEHDYARAERAYISGDIQEAVDLLAYLAASGHAKAQTLLGIVHETGRLVQKDVKRARALYRSAADQGWPAAQLALARMLSKGIGGAKDDVQAALLFGEAAEQGDKRAQFLLGESFD